MSGWPDIVLVTLGVKEATGMVGNRECLSLSKQDIFESQSTV